MFVQVHHHRLLWVVLVALVILLVAPLLVAGPPTGAPPVGNWGGQSEDGRPVRMTMSAEHGFYLEGTSSEPITAVWSWTPRSATHGVLRCEPVDWPNHPLTTYNVTWLGPNRIELSNDEFRVMLMRLY